VGRFLLVTCNYCRGKGGWTDVISRELGGPFEKCDVCRGSGKISPLTRFRVWYWDHLPLAILCWWDRVRYG